MVAGAKDAAVPACDGHTDIFPVRYCLRNAYLITASQYIAATVNTTTGKYFSCPLELKAPEAEASLGVSP